MNRENFQGAHRHPSPRPLDIAALIARAALAHKVIDESDLFGPRRYAEVVAARVEVWRALRAQPVPWSFPRIGRLFNRDHSTILQTLQSHEEKRKFQ